MTSITTTPNPDDDHGHGSHCAGIAARRDLGTHQWDPCGTGSDAVPGSSRRTATLIGAKVLSSAAVAELDSNIIAGIDHCADQSASGGRADVISMSIGTGNYS